MFHSVELEFYISNVGVLYAKVPGNVNPKKEKKWQNTDAERITFDFDVPVARAAIIKPKNTDGKGHRLVFSWTSVRELGCPGSKVGRFLGVTSSCVIKRDVL
jgi:hypothetical protein